MSTTLQMLDQGSLRHILEAHALFKLRKAGGRIANLSYINLTDMKLEGVDLSDANLTGARLYGASLRDANFTRANLYGCDLRNADLRFARFDRADLRGACLRGANLTAASLIGADLREGMIAFKDEKQGLRLMKHEKRAGELDHAIFNGADLSGARMNGMQAVSADFRDANVAGAVMSQAKLRKANLSGANLTGADLNGADVSGADLTGTVMVETQISGCNLREPTPPAPWTRPRKSLSTNALCVISSPCTKTGRKPAARRAAGRCFPASISDWPVTCVSAS
ncbi:pentapeptide repeat-containing protein [Asticcacaulis taihuensis]|uniref:pentapeptide repeat-containing protein n=1 Tax=Asticcacaulis taihuensis TaxID=260084 RepID=UPI003F7BF399